MKQKLFIFACRLVVSFNIGIFIPIIQQNMPETGLHMIIPITVLPLIIMHGFMVYRQDDAIVFSFCNVTMLLLGGTSVIFSYEAVLLYTSAVFLLYLLIWHSILLRIEKEQKSTPN